jgi:beta-lactamase class A
MSGDFPSPGKTWTPPNRLLHHRHRTIMKLNHSLRIISPTLALPMLFLSATCPAQLEQKIEAQPTIAERNAAMWQAKRQELVDHAVGLAMRDFEPVRLKPNDPAVTLIDLRDPQHPATASYRGEEQIYPASVVKLFYLVAAQQQMEDGKLQDTAELRRAMHDMIVDSLNEATGYIVDLLTDTTSGPELPSPEIQAWHDKREAVNRYFASLGYTNINVNKKPWCEGPYGRETQAIKLFKPSRNMLTTDATARIMMKIVTGKAVSPARCEQMKELLKRDFANPKDQNTQAHDFIASVLPPEARLWSKAGWTEVTRHDAAYIELPNGAKFVLVIFTVNHAKEPKIIQNIARHIVDELGKEK